MSGLFDSADRMGRLARTSAVVAVCGFCLGLLSWPVTYYVAVPAAIAGTTATLIAMYSWFRADHLQQLERERAPERR